MQQPFYLGKKINQLLQRLVKGGNQQVFGRVYMVLFDGIEQTQRFLLVVAVKRFHHFFERIGGFAHGRNNDEQLLAAVRMKYMTYLLNPFYAAYTGAAEFEYLHIDLMCYMGCKSKRYKAEVFKV